jgi:hypothetical protein
VAEIQDGPQLVGHFVGATSRRFGLRVLGSPLSGWGTSKMGFLLRPGASHVEAADALLDFAYGDLGCVHIELWDRRMRLDQTATTRYSVSPRDTWEVDLVGTEEEVLTRVHSRTRTYIRRAPKTGLLIEEVTGAGFADEYHRQLVDVFTSSALVPTYGVERVRSLIEHVEPSGQLLMQRVRDPDGQPIASLITLGRHARATLWGLAWYRSAAKLHPIEPLQWAAMMRWRERGAAVYDLDGAALGKAKFGGDRITEARLHHSRHATLEIGRDAVRRLFYGRQRLVGRWRGRRPVRGDE